jgi:hypothetical protein
LARFALPRILSIRAIRLVALRTGKE